ncbi:MULTISPECIES: lamin tail domain-containing protein [unclassified Mesorhizobium]|uniref:lamin tail domain-containing protein n=1 Tax=unclassified Mesorhizobium TaxID=325217 RepID=UPI001FDEBE7E|nr:MULTISPECIES: lamin tail domain-containing protein [unclassified Mesorhizobium]
MKFQTQAWHTDDVTGNAILTPDPEHPTEPHTPIERDQIPTFEVPDGLVRIIAAYVNDTKTPEHETVTLLNTADVSVNLEGWAIANKQKQRRKLVGTIEAGATRVVDIAAPVALSNKGGIITLLDDRGIKVHGVSYTKEQAQQPGRTIPFQN